MSDLESALLRFCEKLTAAAAKQEPLYVIGHRQPDTDALASSMAAARFLQGLGIRAEAANCQRPGNEACFVLDRFGLEAPPEPQEIEKRRFLLTDHNSLVQSWPGLGRDQVVGIIDHHAPGEVWPPEMPVLCEQVGAASTLVYHLHRVCSTAVPRDMARLLLAGIASDTRGMTRNVTKADETAFRELEKLAEVGDTDALYRDMALSLTEYEGKTDQEIFLSDYREYALEGVKLGIGSVNACGEEGLWQLAQRMQRAMGEIWKASGDRLLFCMVSNKGNEKAENQMVIAAAGAAETLMREAFGDHMEGGLAVFQESLSRKRAVLPRLLSVLEKENRGWNK